jgi:hypothetical protein
MWETAILRDMWWLSWLLLSPITNQHHKKKKSFHPIWPKGQGLLWAIVQAHIVQNYNTHMLLLASLFNMRQVFHVHTSAQC